MALFERHAATVGRDPVLVVALEGWIDAGFAAATSMAALLETIPTRRYASFVPDELIDYRARRPRLRIEDGLRGKIEFVSPQLLVGSDPLGAGVAFLVGPEPDFRWQAFANDVASLATEIGTRLVVGLGAFPVAAPHTRAVRLVATASDPELARKVGFVPGVIEAPAGAAEVVAAACTEAGIPSIGLWAQVPHYVSGMAFVPGALALVEGLAALTGLVIDTDDLRESADASRKRVDELIAQSEEHAALVRRLEEQWGEDHAGGAFGETMLGEPLPSGEELAAELERYLRGDL